MKLHDFEKNKKTVAIKALRENYELPFDISTLTLSKTGSMLKKVRGLIQESKASTDYYKNYNKPAYLKLMFMEQALSEHFAELSNMPTRIVLENEEVEKSQVVLAAQDMVDSIQKMIEQVSDMLVKELPALVDSVQSEIGANESEQFNNQATEALTSIQTALNQSQATMKSALGSITGQAAGEGFGTVEPEPMPGEEEVDLDITDTEPVEEPEPSIEEPESEPIGGVGRAKR